MIGKKKINKFFFPKKRKQVINKWNEEKSKSNLYKIVWNLSFNYQQK